MVNVISHCPHCGLAERVVRNGFNRGGTQRLKCFDCIKTWTPEPNPRSLSAEKEALIASALQERSSQRAIARTFKVARTTVRAILKKSPAPRA